MTARRSKGFSVRKLGSPVSICRKAPRRKPPIEHSLYLGRKRLGQYVQLGHKRFKAFDADDRPLGNFRVRARALAAIRKAWARLA
jgi:hypothetical protein